jgi:hypothetical protein
LDLFLLYSHHDGQPWFSASVEDGEFSDTVGGQDGELSDTIGGQDGDVSNYRKKKLCLIMYNIQYRIIVYILMMKSLANAIVQVDQPIISN